MARQYVGCDWPIIKADGIELECNGATREQAEAIARILTEATSGEQATVKSVPAQSAGTPQSAVLSALSTVLPSLFEAQAEWERLIDFIHRTLDGVLLVDGSFQHISDEDLEAVIVALPDYCPYKVDLKREWRKRQEAKVAV